MPTVSRSVVDVCDLPLGAQPVEPGAFTLCLARPQHVDQPVQLGQPALECTDTLLSQEEIGEHEAQLRLECQQVGVGARLGSGRGLPGRLTEQSHSSPYGQLLRHEQEIVDADTGVFSGVAHRRVGEQAALPRLGLQFKHREVQHADLRMLHAHPRQRLFLGERLRGSAPRHQPTEHGCQKQWSPSTHIVLSQRPSSADGRAQMRKFLANGISESTRRTERYTGGARAPRTMRGGGLGRAFVATGTCRPGGSGTIPAAHTSTSAGVTPTLALGRSTAAVGSATEAWCCRMSPSVFVPGASAT